LTISTLMVLPSVAGFLVGSPPPPAPAEPVPAAELEAAPPELATLEAAPPELAALELAPPELAAELEPATAELAAEVAELTPAPAAEVADDPAEEAVVPLELLHAAVTSIAAQPAAMAALFVQRICGGSFRLVLRWWLT
jgi:hypothetical protein